jgi:hypothetical protein
MDNTHHVVSVGMWNATWFLVGMWNATWFLVGMWKPQRVDKKPLVGYKSWSKGKVVVTRNP